jgi:nucleotide-binding universal stress UspA family protein
MYRRIAVALDATAESQFALQWAVTIARRANCPLELVHVAFPPAYGTELYGAAVLHNDDIEQMEQEAERRLRALADDLTPLGLKAEAVVLEGAVPSALSDHLRKADADLVVMTTHDRRRLERFILGSVSEAVLRRAYLPVLLIRVREGEPPAVTTPVTVRRVLAPFDGSAFGKQILPHVTSFAKLMDADITLLGVLQPMLVAAAIATELGGPPSAALMPAATASPGGRRRSPCTQRCCPTLSQVARFSIMPSATTWMSSR